MKLSQIIWLCCLCVKSVRTSVCTCVHVYARACAGVCIYVRFCGMYVTLRVFVCACVHVSIECLYLCVCMYI